MEIVNTAVIPLMECGKQYFKTSMLTKNEAAKVLNISRPTLDELIGKGELRTKKIGTQVRVVYGSILDWVFGDESINVKASKILESAKGSVKTNFELRQLNQ